MATYSNLFIDQGSDFNFSVDLTSAAGSVDLTSHTGRGQIRKSYTSSTAIDFAISIDVDNSEVLASLSAEQTGAMKPGRYVYDIEILSAAATPIVTRVLEGQIDVTPRVTTN
jgi:hypothetical protein